MNASLSPIPAELTFLEDFMRQSSRPCIALSMLPGAEISATGSKLGGNPALPESFEWPQHEGRPLDFLLQINLAEVPGGTDMGLPAEGLLSFFYDLEKCPWKPEKGGAFRVCLTPAGVALAPTANEGDGQNFKEASIVFREGLSLPYFNSTALDDFEERIKAALGDEASDDEMDDIAEAYGEYCREISHSDDPNPEGGPHRMFGHPENIQEDMYASDSDWVMLLQLASDDTVEMMWGDSGMLYFWMTKADLAARRFDQAIMTLQCC